MRSASRWWSRTVRALQGWWARRRRCSPKAGLRDFEIDNFTGPVEPAGMPADAVAKVHSAAVRALATPQVNERFASLGVQPAGNRPEQLGAVIRKDLAHWRKVIKNADVNLQCWSELTATKRAPQRPFLMVSQRINRVRRSA
jgi:hypothetical protein